MHFSFVRLPRRSAVLASALAAISLLGHSQTLPSDPQVLQATSQDYQTDMPLAEAQPPRGGATAPTFSLLASLGTTPSSPMYPQWAGVLAQGFDGSVYSTSPSGGSSGNGTVFKVSTGGVVTVLHTFLGSDGSSPYGGLTLGRDGYLYGTTYGGGKYNQGTIFKISQTGQLTTLYSFMNTGDGAAPHAPPIQANDGNFYGTAVFSGAYGNGVVYRITSSGSYKVLHSFLGTDGTYPESALLQGNDGYLYGSAYSGGVNNNGKGVLFRISTSGSFNVFYGFDGAHGSSPYGALIQATDGNFYGVAQQGGSLGYGTIFKITPAGVLTVLHHFGVSTGDGQQPYGGLVQGGDGNFYGAASLGGTTGNGMLYELTAAGTYSNIHSFNFNDGYSPEIAFLAHTNGLLYGDSYEGGTALYGTVYAVNAGLPAFVSLLSTAGKVGSTINVLGQGFTSTTKVAFNGVPATSVQVAASTHLVVTVPSGALNGSVTVTTGTTSLVSHQKFNVVPNIASFTPTTGPVGSTVVITGSGFRQTTSVTIAGVKTTFIVDSDSQITATVPSGAKTGSITVAIPGYTVTSAAQFTVS